MPPAAHLTSAELQELLNSAAMDGKKLDNYFRHLADCSECRERLAIASGDSTILNRLRGYRHTRTRLVANDMSDAASRVVERVFQSMPQLDQQTVILALDSESGSGDQPLDSDAAAWRLPLRLGRYLLQRELGRGGEAIVFRAHDTVMDREVALKVPLGGEFNRQEVATRFHQGAQAAGILNHPNICPIYHVDQLGEITFLIMPVVEGRVLRKLVARNGGIDPLECARIVAKVARALDYAHQRHVTHRDLKPANIILDSDGEPKIMDFGLARRGDATADRLTIAGSVLGTPSYMSPEQARGELAIGPATDIYALGVILFELLSGRKPFEGTLSQVLFQINTAPTPSLDSVAPQTPQPLRQICLRAMQRSVEDRYPSAGALAAELEEYLRSVPVDAKPPSGPEGQSQVSEPPGSPAPTPAAVPAQAPVARSRSVYWILAGLLVLAATIVSGMALRHRFPGIGNFITQPSTVVANANGHREAAGARETAGEKPSAVSLPGAAPPATANPVMDRVTLQIDLQRAAEKSGYRPLDNTVVPVRDNDKVQILARLENPAYLYLYWYDAQGQATRLWPTDLETQQPVREAASPPLAVATEELQRWHVIGGVTGREMALAAVSQSPLSTVELQEFEQVRFHMVERRSSGGELAAITRALVGITESPKGQPVQAATQPTEAAVLVLPADSAQRLIVVSHEQLKRALIGTVESLKGPPPAELAGPATSSITRFRDFDQLLHSHFEDYYGLVFAHEP